MCCALVACASRQAMRDAMKCPMCGTAKGPDNVQIQAEGITDGPPGFPDRFEPGDWNVCTACGTILLVNSKGELTAASDLDMLTLRRRQRNMLRTIAKSIRAIIESRATFQDPSPIREVSLQCPSCTRVMSAGASTNPNTKGPQAGQWCVCGFCGEVLRFETSTALRVLSDAERSIIPQALLDVATGIRKRNAH